MGTHISMSIFIVLGAYPVVGACRGDYGSIQLFISFTIHVHLYVRDHRQKLISLDNTRVYLDARDIATETKESR